MQKRILITNLDQKDNSNLSFFLSLGLTTLYMRTIYFIQHRILELGLGPKKTYFLYNKKFQMTFQTYRDFDL